VLARVSGALFTGQREMKSEKEGKNEELSES
jgi:hypothetical protein